MGGVKVEAVGNESRDRWDHKGRTQIVQITVSHDALTLRSLQFHYLENGRVHSSEVIGCSSFYGGNFKTITFEGEHEYVTKVEGIYCKMIETLSIHTNLKVYKISEPAKPSTTHIRKRFSFDFGGLNQFGGFHGTHDICTYGGVSSLGVYFKCLTVPPVRYLRSNTRPASKFGALFHEDEDEAVTIRI